MIHRFLEEQLVDRLKNSSKVLVLYGARQVGKTTLSQIVLQKMEGKVLIVNADQKPVADVLSSRDLGKLKGLVTGYDILFIDEAQRIPDIGINLKLLHDEIPQLRIMVTGSSSLDLANRLREPLTGRTWTYQLYPISAMEWKKFAQINDFELSLKLDEWMRFGLYPEVLNFENYSDKRKYLEELTTSYLYKDILTLSNIRYPEKLRQLLKLLAYQVGNLVSIHELAISLQINRETVIHYIDLLEKSFVLFRLSGFSRNLRKTVTSMDKIYFFDLGVRNALIENFSAVSERLDTGQLWENFLLSERLKKSAYGGIYANRYFWRTHSGAELDYVEEREGQLFGYDFKWRSKKRKAPKSWIETYENAHFQLIHKDNFTEFIGIDHSAQVLDERKP
jgi:predicted AAA+ superfamily ATPase